MFEFIAQNDEVCADCDMELPAGSHIIIQDEEILCSECAASREELAGIDLESEEFQNGSK